MSNPFKISVLISGGGTTLKNLIDVRHSGGLDAQISHVVSSNPRAGGIRFAEENKIPFSVFKRKSFSDLHEFSNAIFDCCRQHEADLVVLGGFLKKITIPPDFTNRVINIHPSLIPAFSGKGFYGMNVHRSVIEYGCKVSGCTVHFVDNEYDHGPVIAQEALKIAANETPESLQARVFELECQIYPAVINQIANGSLRVTERLVTLDR